MTSFCILLSQHFWSNYFISLIVKMVIIFSLNPINAAIEKYLLKKVVKKRRREISSVEAEIALPTVGVLLNQAS